MNFNRWIKRIFIFRIKRFRNHIYWIILPLIFFICTGIRDPLQEYWDEKALDEMEYKQVVWYRERPPLSKWWLITFLSYPLLLNIDKIIPREKSNPFHNKLINFLYFTTLTISLLGMVVSVFIAFYLFLWLLNGCPDNWWT